MTKKDFDARDVVKCLSTYYVGATLINVGDVGIVVDPRPFGYVNHVVVKWNTCILTSVLEKKYIAHANESDSTNQTTQYSILGEKNIFDSSGDLFSEESQRRIWQITFGSDYK